MDKGKKENRCGTVLCSIGIHFGHGHPDNVSRIIQSFQDSNVAQAKAALEALDIAFKHHQKKVKNILYLCCQYESFFSFLVIILSIIPLTTSSECLICDWLVCYGLLQM